MNVQVNTLKPRFAACVGRLACLTLFFLLLGCALPATSQTFLYDVLVSTTDLTNNVNGIELDLNLGGGSVSYPVGISPTGSHTFDLSYSGTGIYDHFSTITIGSGVVYEAEFVAPAGITFSGGFSDGAWLLNGDSIFPVLPSSVTLTQVPEPSVVAFWGLTLAGIVLRRRYK